MSRKILVNFILLKSDLNSRVYKPPSSQKGQAAIVWQENN